MWPLGKHLQTAKAGTWKAGIKILGLKEGGVGYAMDKHNSTGIMSKPILWPKSKKRALTLLRVLLKSPTTCPNNAFK